MAKNKPLETFNTAYRAYKKEVESPVELSLFIKLNNEFALFMTEKILNAKTVYLPHGIGVIKVIGKEVIPKFDEESNRIENLSVNWGATRKLWKENEEAKEQKKFIYHFNEHSDGVRYRFLWSRANMKCKNSNFYTFKPAKRMKQTLAKHIREGREYEVYEGDYTPKIKSSKHG